jgi:hypothetical protein
MPLLEAAISVAASEMASWRDWTALSPSLSLLRNHRMVYYP